MSNKQTDDKQKDEEMICALTADEYGALQRGLKTLPDTMPPRHVWTRIREQAEAEGLFKAMDSRRATPWFAGLGLAAAVLLAVILLPDSASVDPTVVPESTDTNPYAVSLKALQVQSRRLERELRALPAEPKVARASTVATMSEIEDRIAAIDFQLNDSTAEWADGDREIFWRERVRLMNLLLQLRYAQAQRAAY